MNNCVHLKQKLTSDGWQCLSCGTFPPKMKDGIKEIVESGIFPESDVEAIASEFSYQLGMTVSSRRDFREKLARITDPDNNPEHVLRKTPKERQAYIDRCEEQGIIP